MEFEGPQNRNPFGTPRDDRTTIDDKVNPFLYVDLANLPEPIDVAPMAYELMESMARNEALAREAGYDLSVVLMTHRIETVPGVGMRVVSSIGPIRCG